MVIGLAQWVSFAAMLSPYLKTLKGSDFGSKPNRFAIAEVECGRVVISFAARCLGSKKSLRTAFLCLHLVG